MKTYETLTSELFNNFGKAYGRYPSNLKLYGKLIENDSLFVWLGQIPNEGTAGAGFGPLFNGKSVLLHADGSAEVGPKTIPGGTYAEITGMGYAEARAAIEAMNAELHAKSKARKEASDAAYHERVKELMDMPDGLFEVEIKYTDFSPSNYGSGAPRDKYYTTMVQAENGYAAYGVALNKLRESNGNIFFWSGAETADVRPCSKFEMYPELHQPNA